MKFESGKALETYLQAHNGLTKLYIQDSPALVKLPALPASVIELIVENCSSFAGIERLPSGLIYLKVLNCPQLVELPALPHTLAYLVAEQCPRLASLPKLPAGLESLQVIGCDISSVSDLPPSLCYVQITE